MKTLSSGFSTLCETGRPPGVFSWGWGWKGVSRRTSQGVSIGDADAVVECSSFFVSSRVVPPDTPGGLPKSEAVPRWGWVLRLAKSCLVWLGTCFRRGCSQGSPPSVVVQLTCPQDFSSNVGCGALPAIR